MLHTPSLPVTDVSRKERERRENLRQFTFASENDPKPHIDVVDVQAYPQATLTDQQRAIVNCDATALVELIRKGVYTSTQVLTAFVTVAIRANDVTNCLTESCLKDAFERATELDQHLKEIGQVVGPLHGLPVSIKDHIKVKGLDTSAGYTGKHSTFSAHRTVTYPLFSLGVQDSGRQRCPCGRYSKEIRSDHICQNAKPSNLTRKQQSLLSVDQRFTFFLVIGDKQQHLRADRQSIQPKIDFWRQQRGRRCSYRLPRKPSGGRHGYRWKC